MSKCLIAFGFWKNGFLCVCVSVSQRPPSQRTSYDGTDLNIASKITPVCWIALGIRIGCGLSTGLRGVFVDFFNSVDPLTKVFTMLPF